MVLDHLAHSRAIAGFSVSKNQGQAPEPPCPLAPHHTHTERTADQVQVRILFATEPSLESEVRQRLDRALAHGTQQTPTGEAANWELLASRPDTVQEIEREHGERLISS
jgi:hypothetical protein